MKRPTAPGPLLLAALYLVPVALWFGAAPPAQRFVDAATTLTSVGVVCGLAGLSAYSLNLVLGARLRFVEPLFGGLDAMYRAHRRNGRIALLLLLAHALLIVAGRAALSSAALSALFDPSTGIQVWLGIAALVLMTGLVGLTLYVRLGHELFVYVQRSLGVVFMVAALHVFLTPGAKASSPALTLYLVVLVAGGIAAFAYRSLFGSLLVRRLPYRVAEVNRLDDYVTEFVMDPQQRPLRFVPGQFVYVNFRSWGLSRQLHPLDVSSEGQSVVFAVRFGDITNQFHPFSITSAPSDKQLRITVKAVGDYTRAIRALDAGADAVVEGPYGSFSYRNVGNVRQVWLSGGIGLTPFLSMARSLGADEPYDIDLYYCVENERETYFLEEFQAIAARRPALRVIPCIRSQTGLITAERIERTSGDLAARDHLICGPPAMITSLREQLLSSGVPAGQIHAEEFSFTRLGPRRRSPQQPVAPKATTA